jgi:hypothetical protein
VKECFCEHLKEEGRKGHSFAGAAEYIGVLNALKDTAFKQQPPGSLYSTSFKEEWYECPQCGQVWRLVHPDPPFAGLWEKVLP